MCGIVGLFLKNPKLDNTLGSLLTPMLAEMTERGPDSAGFAVYGPKPPQNRFKLTLLATEIVDWPAISSDIELLLKKNIEFYEHADHAVFVLPEEEPKIREFLAVQYPSLHITSAGRRLEVVKQTGLPVVVSSRLGLREMTGSHAIGHTRMATESAVTTEGAHPFNTGDDLCLVHNGSLSNHHQLRDWLRHQAGITFQTDNDSEVAAGYLTWRLEQGATIAEALEAAITDLDGCYTFAVGTRDGFSVLRDPIACKPAVIAETDDWVAMASEYRALAQLPNVDSAKVWEPEPATIYSWGTA